VKEVRIYKYIFGERSTVLSKGILLLVGVMLSLYIPNSG